MKLKLACASLLVLAACGPSREAMTALQDMQILQNDPNAPLSYASISGSGNDVTLSGVEMRIGAGMMALMSGPQTVRIDLDGDDSEDSAEAAAPVEAGEPMTVAKAGSMTLRGLTMQDGKPVVRDIVLNAITPTVPMEGASVSLGSLSFEGMNAVTGQFIASAFTKEGAGAPPAFEQWGFTKAGIGGVTLAIPIPQDEGTGGSVNVQLGEFSISDLKDKTIGLARLDGLKGDVDVPGMPRVAGTFDLGRLDVGGIQTERVAREFMSGFNERMNPGAPVDYTARYKDYTSPLETGIDRVSWNGVKADFSGLKLSLDGLNSSVQRNADKVVTGISFPRATLKLTADSSGGTLGAMGLMMLAMTGYDSNAIEMYVEGAASFDPVKDLTRWDNYNFGVADAFDVKVSLGVEGVQKSLPTLLGALSQLQASAPVMEPEVEIIEEDEDADADAADGAPDGDDAEADAPDAGEDEGEDDDSGKEPRGGLFGGANGAAMGSLILGLLPLQLTDLDLSITDQKLVNLILAQRAGTEGQTPEALRQDLVGMLAGGAVFMKDAGLDAAIANELSAAAAGFMSGPGTLHIQLKPKQPLGVMSAMLMPVTKESLGFSATFTPLVPAVN